MRHILWSGPRESDIEGLDSLICASTTIFGQNQGSNRAYSKHIHARLNHNQHDCLSDDYANERVAELIEAYPDLKILYYNPLYSQFLLPCYRERVIGCNDLSLLELLDSKSDMRRIAGRSIPIVPFQIVDNLKQLKNAMPSLEKGFTYILQENHSSGGNGTHIINQGNAEDLFTKFDPTKEYFVAPYIKKSISINIHCAIFEQDIVMFPGSIQLVKEVGQRIVYLGADYITFQNLSDEIKEAIRFNSKQLCRTLQGMGYRGVLGIDFLLVEQQPLFLEINARFQASTVLLNKAFRDQGLPSMQEIHLSAFECNICKDRVAFESVRVPYSMVSYTAETWKKDVNVLTSIPSSDLKDIVFDGFDPSETIQRGAYLFRVTFQTNLCSLTPDGTVGIYENLFDIDDNFSAGIYTKDPLHIKISLLNQGVVFTQNATNYLKKQGDVRQAVFSAVDLTILDGLQVNCPSDVKFVTFTPWKIDLVNNDELKLFYRDTEICTVIPDMADPYMKQLTQSGIPYQSISFWATDRLRIHHTVSCIFKNNEIGCRFCEVPKQEVTCGVEDIFEVIDFYLENANTFRHFLIGGGSEPLDNEAEHITEIVKHIREKSNKPIYLMCLPPRNKSVLKMWYEAGVTEVAFNLELFDRSLARYYMPGKGSIPLNQYLTALRDAVALWGSCGKVRTLFIAGLEKTDSLLQGLETVAALGVMPIISVFRALKGTDTQNIVPPSNDWLLALFKQGEHICAEYNLHLGPSCSACQNNTLSLPFDMLSQKTDEY